MWSNCATDFDQDEETANFGTRLAVEADGSLYDVVTFATFEPEGEVMDNPICVSSCSSHQVLALALDSCLHIIETNRANASFSVKFSDDIDVLAWSKCEKFVLAGLRSGKVQILHLDSKRPLPAMAIGLAVSEDVDKRNRAFVGCSFISEDNAILFGSTGCLYSVDNLQLRSLNEALTRADLSLLKSIQSAMIIKSERLTDDNIISWTHSDINDGILATKNRLARFSPGDDTGLYDVLPMDYLDMSTPKCLKSTKLKNDLIFGLDESGRIHVICRRTLLLIEIWSEETVLDLVLMEDEGDHVFKIMILIEGEKNGQPERVFQLLEYPSFKKIYEIKVNSYCELLDCCVSQENPTYLEGSLSRTEDCLNDTVKSLRMRGVCESVLDARLQRLIRRQRFEEALTFAQNFNFSSQQIFQAKASYLMEKLSPWRKDELSDEQEDELYKDFKATLSQIKDLDFMVNCCVTAALPKFEQIKSMLVLASDTIQNNIETDISLELMARVSKTLQKLKTFMMVRPKGKVHDWAEFVRSSPFFECKKFLCKGEGDLKSLRLVWSRHKPDIVIHIEKEGVIQELLELIPENWESATTLKWLQDFLPVCLDNQPNSLSLISSWAEGKTRNFELAFRKEWPKNGLEFAEGVLKCLHFNSNSDDFKSSKVQLVLNQQRSQTGSELYKFVHLIDTLKDLLTLHSQFKVKVKLSEFSLEDKQEVVEIILDWCQDSKELRRLILDFLGKFMLHYGLDQSSVFANYLKELIEQSESSWHWCVGDAPWEGVAEVLLEFITSNESKIDVILNILRSAPVPWSKTIQSICDAGLKLSHPNAKLVREQEKMVGLKQVLKKYEFTDNAASGRKLERYIQRMIMKNNREGYEDALVISKISPCGSVFEAHYFFLRHLLFVMDDSTAALETLRTIKTDEEVDALKLSQRILGFAEVSLKVHQKLPPDSVLGFLQSCGQVFVKERFRADILERCRLYKKRYLILKEFGKNCLRTTYPTINRSDTLDNFLVEEMKKPLESDFLLPLHKKMLRLATLIGESEGVVISKLMRQLTQNGYYMQANEVSKSFENLGEQCNGGSVAQRLNLVKGVTRTLRGQENDLGNIPQILKEMSSELATFCNQDNLITCVEMSRFQHYFHRFYQLYHQNLSVQEMGANDPFTHWKFDYNFTDKGLPLDEKVVGPLLDCLVKVFDRDEPLSEEVLDELNEIGCSLTTDLRNFLHIELSESFGVLIAETIFVNSTQETADMSSVLNNVCPNSVLQELVVKILGEKRKLDFELALGYLRRLPSGKALGILNSISSSFSSDYSKLINLATLGIRYTSNHNLIGVESFKNLMGRACWAKKISDLGISFQKAFTGGQVEWIRTFNSLVTKSNLSVQNLMSYCKFFDIELTFGMLSYVRSVLLNLEPVISEDEKKVSKPLNFEIIKNSIETAIANINEESALEEFYLQMFQDVSPYNYEALEFILQSISKVRGDSTMDQTALDMISRAAKLLEFFSNYKRTAEPTSKEKEFWQKYRNGENFPNRLSKYRLPVGWLASKFTSKEKFKLIVREISLDNFELWNAISKTLKISPDYVCVHAVQNAIEELNKATLKDDSKSLEVGDQVDENEEWALTHVNLSLLARVESCIAAIVDPEKAVSCGFWFVKQLPGGSDKILAALGCKKFALEWNQQEHSQDSIQALNMVKSLMLSLKTRHVLHKFDLWNFFCKCHLKLDEADVYELVETLYRHESIIERKCSAGGRYPDINKAAQEISEVHDDDLMRIQLLLLDKWLPPSGKSSNKDSLDETVSNFKLHFEKINSEMGENEDEHNLERCIYMAQKGDPSVLNYLLELGYSKEPQVNSCHKLRALKCLISSVSDEAFFKMGGNLEDIKAHMQSLHFITRLEKLNLSYTPEKFEAVEKLALIEGVLRSSSHLADGVSLIVDLCVHFYVFEPKLWMKLLKQMVRLAMLEQLDQCLSELNNHPHLWHFPEFLEAWKFLLMRPFTQTAIPVSDRSRKECEKSIERLSKCPLDFEVQLLLNECKRLKLDDLEKKLAFVPSTTNGHS